jgi:hypothetical protein
MYKRNKFSGWGGKKMNRDKNDERSLPAGQAGVATEVE